MTTMDQIHRIRELFYEQGKNLNEIAIIMNCDWRTVRKYVDMEDFSSPPPAPVKDEEHNSKLDPFKPQIDSWLAVSTHNRVLTNKTMDTIGFEDKVVYNMLNY